MNKKDVIEFFDSRSSSWDKEMETDDYKMNQILDAAQIKSGKSVLDIACGTGVMIDYYIKRNVSDVTGVDISSKMIEIAENKFRKYDNINFICCDAETYRFNQKYDSIMVFNAFPHFVNPKALIKNLVKAVKSGGTVTVAHDRGRKSLDNHHKSVHASKISNGLMSEDDLEKIFVMAGITDIYKKSTDDIYIVSGKKI
jgi:ubiquinone/menaquinone biosynthesis C-methylase UbiE